MLKEKGRAAHARPSLASERWTTVWESGPQQVLTEHKYWRWALALPAFLPFALMARALVTVNGATIHGAGNDVFGTGGALLLFTMLTITPLRTLTGAQWFVPLRRWYGVMFGLDIFLDAITASNDPAFNDGPVNELFGHTFLLLGVTMTLILIPLWVQGVWNKWSFKQLGTYWKPIQKYGTYAVWTLLGIHLMLLEGFGLKPGNAARGPDSMPYELFHARFYDYLGCSVLMVVLRLPPVRRWLRKQPKWKRWLVISPLVAVFLIAYVFFVNEMVYKGIAAANLSPISD
jgi:DMSO/TMAO reductase YedYZ heme-binding membrane subunit